MSAEQRESLEAILRQSAFPADSDVNELRRVRTPNCWGPHHSCARTYASAATPLRPASEVLMTFETYRWPVRRGRAGNDPPRR